MSAAIVTIAVQEHTFNVANVHQQLSEISPTPGAVVTFTGLVRDFDNEKHILALHLEHYPGMTEKSLHEIAEQATARWPLQGIVIIHRIGRLEAGDAIVLVATASAHRNAAFAAADFVMDYLKNDAPFWKKEIRDDGEEWVAAKQSDRDAKSRW